MKILLVDADSKKGFPNLALMKLSAWHKRQGHSVELIKGIPTTAPLEHYDKVLVSCIFYQNKEAIVDYASQFDNVIVGGSGVDLELTLDDDVEHIMPDYSLYDIDFSIGFTSRGCIRSCPFCIVSEKEGFIHAHAPIREFHHPDHKKIVLLDNNFLASPRWLENLNYLRSHSLKVNFNQGFDVRVINEEVARCLIDVRYYNWKFKTRGFHIAFDDIRHEAGFRHGIELLLDVGIPSKHIMVYVLVGFNSTHEEDFRRCDIILEYGAKPFIQPYNNTREPWVRHLARYYNRKYYEFVERNQYNGGVLYDHCVSMQQVPKGSELEKGKDEK